MTSPCAASRGKNNTKCRVKKTYDDMVFSISTTMTIWSEDGTGLRFLRL